MRKYPKSELVHPIQMQLWICLYLHFDYSLQNATEMENHTWSKSRHTGRVVGAIHRFQACLPFSPQGTLTQLPILSSTREKTQQHTKPVDKTTTLCFCAGFSWSFRDDGWWKFCLIDCLFLLPSSELAHINNSITNIFKSFSISLALLLFLSDTWSNQANFCLSWD